MNKLLFASLFALAGCGGGASYVRSDTTLGRVVVYRNGVAYFERYARVDGDTLSLEVPADKVDDFLKSLTVVDARTGEPAPIAYPTKSPPSPTGNIDMKIHLGGAAPHELKLSYVTEAPSWKPSYRVVLGKNNKVNLQAFAIVDNTSGEDWKSVRLGVGASSALSFRYDLQSIRLVQRETLHADDLFAQAPPMGGATYGYRNAERGAEGGKRIVGELSDDALATVTDELDGRDRDGDGVKDGTKKRVVTKTEAKPTDQRNTTGAGKGRAAGSAGGVPGGVVGGVAGGALGGVGQSAPPPDAPLKAVARNLQSTSKQVIIEGYADKNDGDKYAASLERANRVREQLIRNGARPEQVVAIGNGEQPGRSGGVRIVEAPPQAQPQQQGQEAQFETAAARLPDAAPPPTEPIGTSHFESRGPMTVKRGTSAMISILHTDTAGEVVYLYDAESPRGHAEFPFRSVRIENPTESALESGPVTVFGEGKFIGEGLCEPIPARSAAFVPFALDRQIVVERKETDRDEISRILAVQRGVFSTEVQHTKRWTFVFHNRLPEAASVYLRHTVASGYTITKAPPTRERIGAAHLFRVEVPPSDKLEVVLEEATPLFKSTDLRSPGGMELVKVYLSSGASEGPLKAAVGELLKLQQEIGNLEQHIGTMREQMGEYRGRMDELHAQIVTLKVVKTGGPLMQNLEKKLQEVSDKLSKSTIDLVALQEKLMVTRIRFQDGVADLSLEKKPEPAAPAAPATAPAKPESGSASTKRLGI